jgi:hypothetical protein
VSPIGYTADEWAEMKGVPVDIVVAALEANRLTLALDGSIASSQPAALGVSEADLARERGVSREAVNRARARGWLILEADGTVNLKASMERWNREARPRPEGRTKAAASPTPTSPIDVAPVTSDDPTDTRDRYNKWNADLVEQKARLAKIRADEAEGKLVDRDEVKQTVFTALRALRDDVLAIPDRYTGQIAGIMGVSNTHQVRDLLRESVIASLEKAEQTLRRVAGEVDGGSP